MATRIRCVIGVAAGCLGLFVSAIVHGGNIETVAGWIPKDAVFTISIERPGRWIEQWEKSPLRQALENNPAVRKSLDNPGLLQLEALVGMVELHTKQNRWVLAKKLLGGGLFVAALPRGQAVLVAEAEDPETLRQVHEFLVGLAKLDAQNKGQPGRVRSAEYRGVTGWTFGGDEAHAIIGNRLVLTNKAELLKEIVDRSLDGPAGSLEENPKYAAARKACLDYNLWAYLDLEVLRALPNVQKGLNQSREPLPILLLAGTVTALQRSPWLALGLNIEGTKISGTLRSGKVTDWPEEVSFAVAPANQGALPPLEVPNTLLSMTFYRNLRDFYARKNELFPERTSGLIFFENMMGIFFTGRNFTEEVLAELEPHVRVVVAAQRYSPEVGTPAIQLPAFAVVFRMKNPEKFKPIIEEGFQKALGLVNFIRGQDARPGLLLDRPEYQGVKYTLAYFTPDPQADKNRVDIRFNFSPTLVCRNRDLVLSSAESLARDILDALARQEATAEAVQKSVTTHLRVLGSQIAQLLELNKEALIAQNMAEKGHSREAAEQELAQLLQLLRTVQNIELVERLSAGMTHWDFQMDLTP